MITQIEVSKITPDINQPRKYFDAAKLFTLKESIKKHGIKSPLTVEDMGGGKYLLTDGERRFRAAQELKLKQVPVVVEKSKSPTERLIVQFNIQEQHEGWTQTEKANAILAIADKLGEPLAKVLKMLNVTDSASRRYMAFATLVDKETFTRNEIPLEFAECIRSVKTTAISQSQNVLEQPFTRNDEKRLEHRVIELVKKGDIRKRGDILKIKDSFAQNPKSIEKFLGSTMGTVELFKTTKAKGAYHLRNLINNAMYVRTHANAYMALRDIPLTPAQIVVLKDTIKSLKTVLDLVE